MRWQLCAWLRLHFLPSLQQMCNGPTASTGTVASLQIMINEYHIDGTKMAYCLTFSAWCLVSIPTTHLLKDKFCFLFFSFLFIFLHFGAFSWWRILHQMPSIVTSKCSMFEPQSLSKQNGREGKWGVSLYTIILHFIVFFYEWIANIQSHNVSHCSVLWACREAIFSTFAQHPYSIWSRWGLIHK